MPAKLQNARANLTGPQGRLYAEPTPSSQETSFQQDNVSAEYYVLLVQANRGDAWSSIRLGQTFRGRVLHCKAIG